MKPKAKSTKRTRTKSETPATRAGTKSDAVVQLLKRPTGASIEELMKATGWQSHSVRGFLAGSLAKKTGAKVASTKGEDGVRRYTLGH